MAIQYTYIPVASEEYPDKKGVGRIEWNDNGSENPKDWTENNREYFEVDPRETPVITDEQFMKLLTPELIQTLKKLFNQ